MLHKCHYQHFEGSLLWKQFRHHRPSRSISSLRISSFSILTSFALASTKIHSLHQHCPKTSKYSLKFDSFTLFTSADLILLGALINESAFVTMIDVPSCFLTFSSLPTATIPRSWEFLTRGGGMIRCHVIFSGTITFVPTLRMTSSWTGGYQIVSWPPPHCQNSSWDFSPPSPLMMEAAAAPSLLAA